VLIHGESLDAPSEVLSLCSGSDNRLCMRLKFGLEIERRLGLCSAF
jgi:hypothetical protein